jgi:diguanylate cyclase (GGDEF)-like protein/PAS domain S-box-containing protein
MPSADSTTLAAPRATPATEAAIERSIALTFDVAAAAIALTDLDGRLLRVNDAFCHLLGYERDDLIGLTLAKLTHPDDENPASASRRESIESGAEAYRVEKRYIRKNGDIIWAVAHVTVVREDDGEPVHLLGLVQEITESKRIQADLTRLALHDPLTGVANRILLDDRLRVALARAARHRSLTGVLYLDLDGFKVINDKYGHTVGDEVLRAVASRLRAVLRPSDVVARVGGDEFVAVCEELDGKGEGEAIAARVDTVIRQTIKSSAGELRTSASVGLALAEGTADVTADDLIRLADEAMYRAKQAGAGIST